MDAAAKIAAVGEEEKRMSPEIYRPFEKNKHLHRASGALYWRAKDLPNHRYRYRMYVDFVSLQQAAGENPLKCRLNDKSRGRSAEVSDLFAGVGILSQVQYFTWLNAGRHFWNFELLRPYIWILQPSGTFAVNTFSLQETSQLLLA